MPNWNRPKPERLNDTDAVVRGGIKPWTYQASGSKMPNLLDAPYNPEFAFNGRSSTKFRGNTGPNEEGGLVVACKQIPKAC